MKGKLARRWFLIGFFSLIIDAFYGSLMRYKIAYDFPFFHQKNLLNAHSHFAFTGWVCHMLYSALSLMMMDYVSNKQFVKYRVLIYANLAAAYGVLLGYTFDGYKFFSNFFMCLIAVVAIAYAICFIIDSKKMPKGFAPRYWAISGLILNIVSLFGPILLAIMIYTKTITSDWYLGELYYYLHFQYSGFFFFASMAIIINVLPADFPSLKKYFYIFIATVVPTFVLSVLWAKPPLWLYIITVIASFTETIAWIVLLTKAVPYYRRRKHKTPAWIRYILVFSALCLSLKYVLQAISVIPSLSNLVFGFRPIVIAYLHLVLLGVYSLFIIGFYFARYLNRATNFARIATMIFLIGVFINEAFLAVQGFAAFAYVPIPYINELLLLAALTLLAGAILLFYSQLRHKLNSVPTK